MSKKLNRLASSNYSLAIGEVLSDFFQSLQLLTLKFCDFEVKFLKRGHY